MGAAYTAGFDGSTFQTQQLLDHANEETAYGKTFCHERVRMNTLYRTAKKCVMKGVELSFDPFWNRVDPPVSTPYWTNTMGMFSIPWITTEANIVFWDRAQAVYSDDAVIRKHLSKKLIFLDAEAAKILCERGYGEYLGVSVGEPVNSLPENAKLMWDLGAREVIREPYIQGDTGRNMPSAHMFAPSNGKMLMMQITSPDCEVISDMYTYDKRYITPAMTCYQNQLGGTVVVMGITIGGNHSQALYNYRRQRLIHGLIRKYCDEIVFLPETPRVFVLMNDTSEESCDFRHLLTLINLSSDTLEQFPVHLPPFWRDTEEIYKLDADGEWKPAAHSATEDGIVLKEPLTYLEPMYLLFR